MMTRRSLIAGSTAMVPGLGRPTPSRFPYPGRPESGPGLGAASGNTLRARTVVVSGGPASGVFVYSGTPAAGNPPIAWMSNSTVDPFGNALPAQGVVSFRSSTGAYSQLLNGSLQLFSGTAGSIQGIISEPNAGETRVLSGVAPGIDAGAQVSFMSKLAAGLLVPVLRLNGGTALNNGSGGAVPVIDNSGLSGFVPLSQTDAATNSNSNNTSPLIITNTWTINANDANVATKYKIDVPLTGTWEGQQLNLGIMLDGVTFTNITPVAAAAIAATHGIAGNAVLTLTCTATGALGTMNVHLDGTLSDSSVARAPAGSISLGGQHNGFAYDTTVSHTIAVAAQWAVAAAGQIVNGVGSEFVRSGS